jgi:REP element-mobilizing transposase RayT
MEDTSKYYARKLPHWQPSGATFFVTMRLAGSIPKHIIAQIKAQKDIDEETIRHKLKDTPNELGVALYNLEKQYYGIFDKYLDSANEPYWLKIPKIATIIADSIDFFEKKDKQLTNHAYCIMPNHLHWVFTLNEDADVLYTILQRMKRHTARQSNIILKRDGHFWERESYDHIIRDANEFDNIVLYTLQNPVKAGFVKNWEDWNFSFVCKDFFL